MTLRFLPLPDLCLVMCYELGGGRRWHQLSPRTRPWPILHPGPQPRLPALPEALKGPDCAQEVSEQRLYEYMKESFVQVSRSGVEGGAGGSGQEGCLEAKAAALLARITTEKVGPEEGIDSRPCLDSGIANWSLPLKGVCSPKHLLFAVL